MENQSIAVLEAINVDISSLTLGQMASRYNSIGTLLGKDPVKKFTDRMTGALRLQRLFVEVRAKAGDFKDVTVVVPVPAKAAATEEVTPEEPISEPVPVAPVFEEAQTPSAPAVDPEIAARARALVQEGRTQRRRRQKVFMYPAASELKPIAADSMRAKVRDLLVKGATFAEVEALVKTFYKGEDAKRISERTYGFIRLLHTYCGYGLREEDRAGGEKVIFVLTPEEWKTWKASRN